jgi:metal-dependent hydrolase (beta-lactamase superfamily II)
MDLNIIQAEYGDCMILEFGRSYRKHYFLIDGGPSLIYRRHLKNELQKINSNKGRLELVIVSHIDNDHINGLLKMMAELIKQRNDNKEQTISIEALWYNSSSQTIGKGNDIARRVDEIFNRTRSFFSRTAKRGTEVVAKGIREGHDLTTYAHELGIPINPQYESATITGDDAAKVVNFEGAWISTLPDLQ